ncbi:MAG TPA: ABC transporter substrate-binding protein [Actinomycetales bacterium]|nr:ABC transporter substrate-binding protein [Actinomycetales bacterium]
MRSPQSSSRTRHRTRYMAAVSGASVLTVVLAACGGGGGTSGAGGTASSGGNPVTGGTLKVLGSSDVDHLDTASAYYTVSYSIERAFSRQLVSYPASSDIKKATSVVADLATDVPSQSNNGISADGKTYTFHMRQDAMWNTQPARPVTSKDLVRGMKRICNPANPSGALSYYEDTIVGFKQFCDGFAKVNAGDPKAMAAYMNGNEIQGIKTPDDSTVQISLMQPALDFLNIMALPFASPAPVEYENYVPDDATFRQHTISDGPYAITTYDAGKSIVLDKNPTWKQSSDPIRHQYVAKIQVTEGQGSDAAVQQQLQAGTADLSWDLPVPTASIPALKQTKDPNFAIFPSASNNPYLVFNMQSPNNNKALSKVGVRQALEYAIDKTAIGKIYGGPDLNTPLDQVIPPGQAGYQPFDLYPTPNHKGDPAKCKSMLAQAGYPNGLTLTDVARNAGNHPAVAQSVQADFAKCGVKTKILPVNQGDYYGKYLNNPATSKAGSWDVSEPGWVADWYGNNGRSFIAVLFDGRKYGPNTVNYGDYNSPAVNALIDKSLSATNADQADSDWAQADKQIMTDAAFIPFQTQSIPHYHASRVKNAMYSPFADQYDFTNLWLSGG